MVDQVNPAGTCILLNDWGAATLLVAATVVAFWSTCLLQLVIDIAAVKTKMVKIIPFFMLFILYC